jgi:Uma2 family endonuclease
MSDPTVADPTPRSPDFLAQAIADQKLVPPPGQADLPCDDGEPMETQRHKLQMDLLIDGLGTWLEQRSDGYVNGNMFIYYSMEQVRNRDFKGPDFFAVLGVPKAERKSWVIWEEGKAPDVVIELLSDSTAAYDKTLKKQIYQDQMRVSEYYWFDPFRPDDLAGFILQQGVYQPIAPTPHALTPHSTFQSILVSPALGLSLVRWEGSYKTFPAVWLRWASLSGEVLPIAEEIAERERERADLAQQQADLAQQQASLAQQQVDLARQQASLAQQRAEQSQQQASLAQQRAAQAELQLQQVVLNLRQTGMPIAQIAQITGLSEAQVEAIALS